MKNDFTKAGMGALVGRTFEILLECAGLPKGTRGLVIDADSSGEGFSLVMQWERQVRIFETRMSPVWYWTTKGEMQRFLQEAQPFAG
jgi:hypothetical protein